MKIEVITVGPIDENCHIVYCEEHRASIIVDPGDSGKRIIAFMEEKDLIPKLIVNTHCHADHTGAVAPLVDYFNIPFLCHRDDEWMLNDTDQMEMARYLGLKTPPKNDSAVADGEMIDLCDDFALKVIHTPGHTPGGICLLGEGNLIVGDTLFRTSIGRSDLTGGNHEQLITSIKTRLFTLPDGTVVYPGHGETTTIGYEKQHNPFLRQTEGYT
ncbi:MAG: MBL fold metallo-hydrolase [Nitrospinae bacterium]|nr:MBL fold metallo-hydrolase [Nitrospinota bacterium]